MLRRVLRLAGYEVAMFASGEDFLGSLAVRVPACVILDLNMPGLTGLEVQARLQGLAGALPAIFITGSDDPALDRPVLEAGGVALLRKPFPSDRLLELVQAGLNGPAA